MDSTVARVISAAGCRDEEITSVIESAGPERVAGILVDEIVCRADLPPVELGEGVVVQLLFGHGTRTISHLVQAGPAGVTYEPGGAESPHARIEQDLCEAVRAVFGPHGDRAAATRRLELRGSDTPQAYVLPPTAFWVAQRLLATMDDRDEIGLTELASRYGSDKWGIHRYTQHYQHHFAPLRDRPLTVLEIGVGGLSGGTTGYRAPDKGGGSLRMWKRYFPRALVYGIDIADKRALSEQRITVLRADQSNADELHEVVEQTGPLDIVIDDGSHRSEHVLTSFTTLFPHLRDGGLYVIEDLQTSYWPRFGGNSDVFDSPTTSVGFLKSLVDALHYEEILDSGGRAPGAYDRLVKGLHFYHNIGFVEKGLNAEGGGPSWLRHPPRRRGDRGPAGDRSSSQPPSHGPR
ncbi:class I SAM-dependent methyltransferase [Streptomyces sp. SID7499]|uniref:Class I SAM-dependent methyltransferase n=1 Tax=Streptomyces sp. SID7499 TaxID=2706086 RepID=A0A6G3X8M5_9ACTN|nr:class I SAM-dependent methyltransferase [Streptomyces sp. SID7499]